MDRRLAERSIEALAGPGELAQLIPVARAAALVREGAAAFAEGNPWRARKVRADATALLLEAQGIEDELLAGPGDALEPALRRLASAEGLARAAQQLAGLAESRPAIQAGLVLTDAFRAQADAVVRLIDATLDQKPLVVGEATLDLRGLMDAVSRHKGDLVQACMTAAREAPRAFTHCMLTAAAGQRLEEAAEHASALVLRPAAPA